MALAVAMVGVSMQLQMGTNANFLAGTLGMTGRQVGLLEAARESCGITALGVLAVLAGGVNRPSQIARASRLGLTPSIRATWGVLR